MRRLGDISRGESYASPIKNHGHQCTTKGKAHYIEVFSNNEDEGDEQELP